MTAIAGILTPPQAAAGRQAGPLVACMLELMNHQGGGAGRRELEGVVLGRLGQDGPRQEGGLTLAWDGELSRRAALAAELGLEAGAGEEQVVLAAYRRWGDELAQHLEGAWALALWDAERRCLLLGRDRMGQRPLYICRQGPELAFASEIKALAAFWTLGGRNLEMDPAALEGFLNQGWGEDRPASFFVGLDRFPPGQVLSLQPGGQPRYRTYWDPEQAAACRREELAGYSQEELAQKLRALLQDSLDRCLEPGGRAGIILEPGPAAAGLAALAGSQAYGVWALPGLSPSPPPGISPREVSLAPAQFLDELPRLLWHLDEPVPLPWVYPLWRVWQEAAGEVEALVSARGADLLWAGGPRHLEQRLLDLLLAGDVKGYQELLAGFQAAQGRERAGELAQRVRARYLEKGGEPAGKGGQAPAGQGHRRLAEELRCHQRLAAAQARACRHPYLDQGLLELALALQDGLEPGRERPAFLLGRALQDVLPRDRDWADEEPDTWAWFREWAAPRVRGELAQLLTGPQARLPGLVERQHLESELAAWAQDRGRPEMLWRFVLMERWLATYHQELKQAIARWHARFTAPAPEAQKPEPAVAPEGLREEEDRLLSKIPWAQLRVLCALERSQELARRFGSSSPAWHGPRPPAGQEHQSYDALILDRADSPWLGLLRPGGVLVLYGPEAGQALARMEGMEVLARGRYLSVAGDRHAPWQFRPLATPGEYAGYISHQDRPLGGVLLFRKDRDLKRPAPSQSPTAPARVQREPEEIIFVKVNPQIRIYKEALGLKRYGGRRLVLMAKSFDQQMMSQVFDEIVPFQDGNQLVELVKKRKRGIFHAHAEPNLVPALVLQHASIPVIYDAYDLAGLSRGIESLDPQERQAERFCMENAAGIVSKHPLGAYDYYRNLGYRPVENILIYEDYCAEEFMIPLADHAPKEPGQVRMLYVGTLAPLAWPAQRFAYMQYHGLARDLDRQKVHLHIFANPFQYNDQEYRCYQELDQELDYFHWEKPVHPFQLSQAIAHCHWGTYFTLVKKAHPAQPYEIGNKIASYLEAGLPIVVASWMELTTQRVREMGVELIIDEVDELKDIAQRLLDEYPRAYAQVDQARHEYSIANHWSRLDGFYQSLLS